MNKIFLLLMTAILVFSHTGMAKTNNDLGRQITKLTKSNDKHAIKITKLTARYNEDSAKSNSLNDKGESLIATGKQGQIDTLNEYTSYVKQLGNAQNSKDLKEEIKALKKIQSTWKGFEKDIKSGEKAMSKSSKLNLKATKTKGELDKLTKKFDINKSKINRLLEQKGQSNIRY